MSKRLVLVLVSVVLCGCPKDIPSVDRFADKLENSADKLANGLKGVDPVALNRLLDDNAALRASFDELRSQMNKEGSSWNVAIGPNSKVYFEIEWYRGAFHVDGWLNEQNDVKFYDDQPFTDGEVELDVDTNLFSSWLTTTMAQQFLQYTGSGDTRGMLYCIPAVYPHDATHTPHNRGLAGTIQTLWAHREARDQALVAHFNAAFEKYLKSPGALPSAGKGQVSIGVHTLISGKHHLNLAIRPVALDRNGEWFVQYRMVAVGPQGREDHFAFGSAGGTTLDPVAKSNAFWASLVTTDD